MCCRYFVHSTFSFCITDIVVHITGLL
jgi:hypothetical protein